VRSSRERGIHPSQPDCEGDEAGDTDERDNGSAAPPQSDPEREATGDFEECRRARNCDVRDHISSRALTNHPPRHVHVYRDGKLIVKWDLDNQKAMKGAATRRILDLISELEAEGLL
jgi:hypothetical protein